MKKKTVKSKKKTAKKVVRKTVKKKETGMVVVTSPVDPSAQIMIASELADDAMIEAEMMGDVLPHFVYEFEQNGKPVKGLTVKGVNEVVRRLNRDKKSGVTIRIRPEFMKIEHNIIAGEEVGVQVSIFAENLIDGNSAWGIKFEPYKKISYNKTSPNTFATEKALSKAERNAKRKLIPEVLATKMITKMMKEDPNVVRTLDAPPQYQIQAVTPKKPTPSTPEELEAVIIDAMHRAKTADAIIDLDNRAQKGKNLTNDAKKKIHSLASSLVDQMN